MNLDTFLGLLHNAALLLAVCFIYSLVAVKWQPGKATTLQGLTGVILGGMGIVIMLTPWQLIPGVFFDTRSVLLCVSGLFFGTVTTVIAIIATGAFRLIQGGSGALTGVLVILSSGAIGIIWGHFRKSELSELSWPEIYGMGIVVHLSMLLLMLTLPWSTAKAVLSNITLPVLLIYPAGVALVGVLMRNRLAQEKVILAVAEREELFRRLFENSHAVMFIVDPNDGALVDANPAAEEFYGWSRDDLRRMKTSDINILSPEEVKAEMELAEKEKRKRFYFQHRLSDGSVRDVEVYSGPVRVEGRSLLYSIIHDITERTLAEEALRRSEKDLKESQRIAHVGNWRLDISTNDVVWSEELYRMYGFDPALPPPPYAEHMKLFTGESWEQLSVALARTANTGVPYELELETVREDGDNGWMWVKGEAVKDEFGNITGLWGAAQDITERKRAEEQQQKGFDLLNNLARLVPGVIYQYRLYPDGSSAFPYSSPGMYDIYEVTPEEVQEDASAVFERLHPEDIDRVSEEIFESARTLNTFQCELRVILPSKGLGWRWAQAHPERTEDGGTLWHGIILDTTERKMAEEALRERDERLRAIMAHSPLLISEVDLEGRYQQANPAVANLFRKEISEIVGKRFHDLLPTETAQVFMKRIERVKEQRKSITIEDHLPESQQYFISTLFPLFNNAGDIRSIGSIAYDITDRKRADEEREKLQTQLQQARKMEAIGTLTGGVAHDFNNLLQAINGYTQLLIMDKPEDDPDRRSLTAIQQSGKRAADLVRSLLLFSRKADSERKPMELNQEVERARTILERTIPKMIEIDIQLGGRLWTISADPVQMEQILLNLGTNAADSMLDGGKLTIETANITLDEDFAKNHLDAQPGRYVQLTISDTGHGMDRETQEKIFEPFFTTKEFGKGTGLGLASVYGIVKSHGGYIHCYSEIGQGTIFKIYFPAMDLPVDKAEKDIIAKPPRGGDETILIVDDEEAIRGFAQQALMAFGYKVFTASTGEEALEVYRDQKKNIDLVITDIGMPGMGGHRLLRELLQINPEEKVIIASGYSINSQVIESKTSGAKGYVGKPYQLADLMNSVRAVLDEEK